MNRFGLSVSHILSGLIGGVTAVLGIYLLNRYEKLRQKNTFIKIKRKKKKNSSRLYKKNKCRKLENQLLTPSLIQTYLSSHTQTDLQTNLPQRTEEISHAVQEENILDVNLSMENTVHAANADVSGVCETKPSNETTMQSAATELVQETQPHDNTHKQTNTESLSESLIILESVNANTDLNAELNVDNNSDAHDYHTVMLMANIQKNATTE